ncbi:hypothetical protein [Fusobacterium polymorphum]|uniref:Uncharacterized protein n=1 Tax=Fusobacterium nucleatum subsp. polymorphum TaxID=76857 RepID=A0A2C6BQR1_FUSNP|nr:hypothetical protein [Fusobacterium polymorphum]PHI06454.1 hypothetical protein CBG54_05185 [Fusobacterium polymorphum]
MKIISKFKDFYDYKVAKYGMDEKLVYTRKTYCEYYKKFVINVYTGSDNRISEENFNKNLKENFEYFKGINFHKILVLGEKLVHLFFTENGVYTHFDAKKLDVSKGTYQSYYSKEITFNDGRNFEITTVFGYAWDKLFSYDRKKLFSSMRIDKSDIIFNEPMILIEYFGESHVKYHRSLYKFTYNPNLSQMGVYIDEDFIWQSLVDFLSNKRSEKEISPEVSNENKILSKGFDLKTSFRPNMKKKHKGDI